MRRKIRDGDPELAAIETMRRRWTEAASTRADLEAFRAAMKAAFPGRTTRVLSLAPLGFPGAVRLFVAGESWRSTYAFELRHVADFAAGARRVNWPRLAPARARPGVGSEVGSAFLSSVSAGS